MKALILIIVLILTSNSTIAQTSEDCQNMVKLRDRSGSLDLALGKIDTGISITLTQNGSFTSQFMTILLFESYVCQLNQTLLAKGQAPISREVIEKWVDELNNVYSIFDEATDGKFPGTIKSSFNKARSLVTDPWKAAGAKTLEYQERLPVNVSSAFLQNVPAINLTTTSSGSAYIKTVVNQGFSGDYLSVISKGEELVGNQLYALQNMRKSVGLYAAGSTPAATMLRDITNGITHSVSQITDKKSTALLKEQMSLDAEAKAREAIQSTASIKIADLEKRLIEVEKKLK